MVLAYGSCVTMACQVTVLILGNIGLVDLGLSSDYDTKPHSISFNISASTTLIEEFKLRFQTIMLFKVEILQL